MICTSVFSDGLEPPKCTNKAVKEWGSEYLCLACYEACERGYQESIKGDR